MKHWKYSKYGKKVTKLRRRSITPVDQLQRRKYGSSDHILDRRNAHRRRSDIWVIRSEQKRPTIDGSRGKCTMINPCVSKRVDSSKSQSSKIIETVHHQRTSGSISRVFVESNIKRTEVNIGGNTEGDGS